MVQTLNKTHLVPQIDSYVHKDLHSDDELIGHFVFSIPQQLCQHNQIFATKK